jgi:hypothetical protein
MTYMPLVPAADLAEEKTMPFIKCIPIANFSPKEKDLLALKQRLPILVGDRPSDIYVKTHVSKCDAWSAAFEPRQIMWHADDGTHAHNTSWLVFSVMTN